MTFRLVKGTFKPAAGIPDGDSVRFAPDNPAPLFELPRRGRALRINQNNGTVQLRFEGIDAVEKQANHEYSVAATQKNFDLLGLVRDTDEVRGYILSNQVGPNGRPISFIYAGNTEQTDGSEIYMDVEMLRGSVNYQLAQSGLVYPLFYDSLYHDLRSALAQAVAVARADNLGIWPVDATLNGVEWAGSGSLPTLPPIFPKLWRRLERYTQNRDYRDESTTLAAFAEFLDGQRDRVVVISSSRATDLVDIVEISGDRLRMAIDPLDLFFIS